MNARLKLEEALRTYSRTGEVSALVDFVTTDVTDGTKASYVRLVLASIIGADQPDAEALLGNRYLYGNTYPKDVSKGISMLNHAMQSGSRYAGYWLGLYYYENAEYAKAQENLEQTLKYESTLDDDALRDIYCALAWIYTSEHDNKSQQAVDLLKKAADKYHDPYAAWRLALIYGTDEMHRKNPMRERHYYEAAIKWAGDFPESDWRRDGGAQAAAQLALEYLWGNEEMGIVQDMNAARALVSAWDKTNDPDALTKIGIVYHTSSDGAVADVRKTIDVLSRCMEIQEKSQDGVPEGILGEAYAMADNLTLAEKYLSQAEKLGNMRHIAMHGRVAIERHDYGTAIRCHRYLFENKIISFDSLLDYVNLLTDSCSGALSYSEADRAAQYGWDEYNDVAFAYVLIELQLTGKIPKKMYDGALIQWMEQCMGFPEYRSRGALLLGDYLARNGQYPQAIRYYEQAFQCGMTEVALKIADIYEHGGGSLAADMDTAYRWYEKAAQRGNQRAIAELECFKKGLFGGYRRVKRL